ncbi:MAG: ferrous iron transport protein A [Oscillospiraceae bacterium]|nr:ferrous iron transport protein A [Oscillospiraceae bacterium]
MDGGAINLYSAEKNNVFTVVSVPNIGLLENLGIRLGTTISLQNRYAFGGPVVLRVEDAYSVALGKDVASQITVKEAGL